MKKSFVLCCYFNCIEFISIKFEPINVHLTVINKIKKNYFKKIKTNLKCILKIINKVWWKREKNFKWLLGFYKRSLHNITWVFQNKKHENSNLNWQDRFSFDQFPMVHCVFFFSFLFIAGFDVWQFVITQ